MRLSRCVLLCLLLGGCWETSSEVRVRDPLKVRAVDKGTNLDVGIAPHPPSAEDFVRDREDANARLDAYLAAQHSPSGLERGTDGSIVHHSTAQPLVTSDGDMRGDGGFVGDTFRLSTCVRRSRRCLEFTLVTPRENVLRVQSVATPRFNHPGWLVLGLVNVAMGAALVTWSFAAKTESDRWGALIPGATYVVLGGALSFASVWSLLQPDQTRTTIYSSP